MKKEKIRKRIFTLFELLVIIGLSAVKTLTLK